MFSTTLDINNLRKTRFHVASQSARSSIKIDFEDLGPKIRTNSFLPNNYYLNYSKDKLGATHSSAFHPPQSLPSERKIRTFFTGSKYIGEYNALGLARRGIYKYPHGVIYDGFFNKNGEFHGTGSLIYPSGQRVEGVWRNGKLVKGANYVSKDGTPFASEYCKMPDRRFQIEIERELAPANEEYLTNAPNPPREIREGGYDSGEGYYVPKDKLIYDYNDATLSKQLTDYAEPPDSKQKEIYQRVLAQSKTEDSNFIHQLHQLSIPRSHEVNCLPTELKEKWIIQNCRKAWDEPVEYHPRLYENWIEGSSKYLALLNNRAFSAAQSVSHDEIAKMDDTSRSGPSSLVSFIILTSNQDSKAPIKLKVKRMRFPRKRKRQYFKMIKKIRDVLAAEERKRQNLQLAIRKKPHKDNENNIVIHDHEPKNTNVVEWQLL